MSWLPLVERYLRAVEAFRLDELVSAELFDPDFEQIEFPNALNPKGQKSDLFLLLKRSQAARGLLAAQRFEIKSHAEEGDRLFVEASWSGEIAGAAGPLKK